MAKTKVKIIKDAENPEPVEIIAQAIIEISKAAKKLSDSQLKDRALLLLIHDNCGPVGPPYKKFKPTISQIKSVLESIETLKARYIKKIAK